MLDEDVYWVRKAIALAQHAESMGEVPIGAVLVAQGKSLGEGWNQSIKLSDPTAHAEIVALRQAGAFLQNYRLLNTTLYSTIEPCAMCAGALIHARVGRLVFGAMDPKAGAVASVFTLLNNPALNHRVVYESGILAMECGEMLSAFFKKRR